MTLIGIDPGSNTGIAIYTRGQLAELLTIHPIMIYELLDKRSPGRVIFEDSRLQTFVWTSNSNAAVAKSMARKVGQVDMVCGMIEEACGRIGIECIGMSPLKKGAKLNAAKFATATAWAARSNEHERDAAMVAWPYRRAVHG